MHVYLGTFLIAFATLALELTLTRLLSVISWYHLAFFAVSTAMLGMTAGAATVYLKPDSFAEEKLTDSISKACLGYAFAVPMALVILCWTPLASYIHLLAWGNYLRGLSALSGVTLACSLPFYFSGIAVTAVLTKYHLPIGKLYASDLAGAALGCLFVLEGLELLDAPSLILLSGSVAGLAAFSFAWRSSSFKRRRESGWVFGCLIVLVMFSSLSSYGIRPVYVKGRIERSGSYLLEKWNSYSRVVVYKLRKAKPVRWGPSLVAPRGKKIFQHEMNIDGWASTTMRRFTSIDDIKHLRYDLVNIAYYLRSSGGACIIGVGGGTDIQSAIMFGHTRILGIDVNPIFIDLLLSRFREFAGIADHEGVTLVVDEARSYLSRTDEKYSIIQMSVIDTWAATGVGAFSLSENALYTKEAWSIFFDRLSDDGIFTVSRWHSPQNIGETGRVVSLAVATLLESEIANPSQHIAVVNLSYMSTLLLSKQPFSKQDIAKLRKTCLDLWYNLVILPGEPPRDRTLRAIISANSQEELRKAIANQPLNFEPPTDDSPYFFNMLRLNYIRPIFWTNPGVVRGNLIASLTLFGLILSLSLLTVATVVFPLVLGTRSEKLTGGAGSVLWSGAAYFSLIGAGFMFVEIALIQRLSVFLGHPVYALGILLFSMIASAGVGSFLSERLPITRMPWVLIYPVVIAVAIIAVRFVLPTLARNLVSSPMVGRIFASILVIIPLGILLGVCFPTGMRLVQSARATETPWYWALNGIFGVLSSALTVFISIYFGISMSLYIAATCYIMLLLCLPRMWYTSQDSHMS